MAGKALLRVLGVLGGFLYQCRESTAEDTKDTRGEDYYH